MLLTSLLILFNLGGVLPHYNGSWLSLLLRARDATTKYKNEISTWFATSTERINTYKYDFISVLRGFLQ